MPPRDKEGACRTSGALPIGAWKGVQIEMAPLDAVSADASLAIAGMFEREAAGTELHGGLQHLDHALGGALLRLRSDGIFSAAQGALLVLSAPSPPICAEKVLMIGLGDPDNWSAARMCEAVATAAREALRLRVASAAFAPGLLDSGIDPLALTGTPDALVTGLIDALNTPYSGARALSRWTFCAGIAHFDDKVRDFRQAFSRHAGA